MAGLNRPVLVFVSGVSGGLGRYMGGYGFATGVLFIACGPVGRGAGLAAEMSVAIVLDGKGKGKGSAPTAVC